MATERYSRQGNLFANSHEPAQSGRLECEPPPPDFIARIRDELAATLERVRGADVLPWPDLTAATLGELRFNSIADWLPPDEASRLRDDFAKELDRIYALMDEAADAAERADQREEHAARVDERMRAR